MRPIRFAAEEETCGITTGGDGFFTNSNLRLSTKNRDSILMLVIRETRYASEPGTDVFGRGPSDGASQCCARVDKHGFD